MASVRGYLKSFRPILIMIFVLLVGFLTYITATDETDDSVNDFAEFETEGDEDEEEEVETQGTNVQEEDEGLIINLLIFQLMANSSSLRIEKTNILIKLKSRGQLLLNVRPQCQSFLRFCMDT